MNDEKLIGSKEWLNGEAIIRPGMINGKLVYKNPFAFRNIPDADCYTPECSFEKCEDEDGIVILAAHHENSYTSREIVESCWGNFSIAEHYFHNCSGEDICQSWEDAHFDDEDFRAFYSFVKKGAIVWYETQDGDADGMYAVVAEPDDEEWGEESIVLISNGGDNIEAFLTELTQPRFVLMHLRDDILQVKAASNWIQDLTNCICYNEDEEKYDEWIIRRFPLRD